MTSLLELTLWRKQHYSKKNCGVCYSKAGSTSANGGHKRRTQVLDKIDKELKEKLPVKDLTDEHSSQHPKALGVAWNSCDDTLSISIGASPTFTPTKRGVISDIAKTFDILGWIAPTLIQMKILF